MRVELDVRGGVVEVRRKPRALEVVVYDHDVETASGTAVEHYPASGPDPARELRELRLFRDRLADLPDEEEKRNPDGEDDGWTNDAAHEELMGCIAEARGLRLAASAEKRTRAGPRRKGTAR